MQQYRIIIERLYQSHDCEVKNNFKTVVNNMLETIRESETYTYSRSKNMRRILPSFVDNENIRVRINNLKMKSQSYQQFQFL